MNQTPYQKRIDEILDKYNTSKKTDSDKRIMEVLIKTFEASEESRHEKKEKDLYIDPTPNDPFQGDQGGGCGGCG